MPEVENTWANIEGNSNSVLQMAKGLNKRSSVVLLLRHQKYEAFRCTENHANKSLQNHANKSLQSYCIFL